MAQFKSIGGNSEIFTIQEIFSVGIDPLCNFFIVLSLMLIASLLFDFHSAGLTGCIAGISLYITILLVMATKKIVKLQKYDFILLIFLMMTYLVVLVTILFFDF